LAQSNDFHTFQHIPPESEPQTAKFLNGPDKLPTESFFSSSQTEPYRPAEFHFENKQSLPPPSHSLYHFNPPQPSSNVIPQNRSGSRLIQFPATGVPSPKMIIQQELPQHRIPTYT
jgi:hypothetical protein